MKRRFGVFQGLVLSLFSPAYYRDVANNWGGIGFVYLLLLFLLTWIPVLAKWQNDAGRFVNNEFADVLKDWPTVSIKAGKASSPVDQPFIVTDPKDGKVIFVLDTTGAIDSLEKTPAQFLVTETQLHVRDQHKIQIHDLREWPDMDISKENVIGWASTATKWLGAALFPFVMVGSLIRALIVMLIAGLVGLAFRSLVNPNITYGSLVRLAAMGITLPTYIDTAATFAGVPIRFWFLITIAITTLYVVLGAQSAASGARPLPLDDFAEPSPPYPERDTTNPDAFRA